MEESIKKRVILLCIILTAIFFVGMVGSCYDGHQKKLARDKEMAKRLDSEEKLSKVARDTKTLEEKLNKLTQDFETEKAAHEVLKKAYLQEQLVSKSLKEELEKVNKLKEALEEKLKEALVSEKNSARIKK